MKDCKHKDLVNIFWFSNFEDNKSVNEDGWFCGNCRKLLGFRPDLDNKMIFEKANSILQELHEAGLIYVSNGSSGFDIAETVKAICKKKNLFDGYTIVLEIMKIVTPSHAKYWKKESKKHCVQLQGKVK